MKSNIKVTKRYKIISILLLLSLFTQNSSIFSHHIAYILNAIILCLFYHITRKVFSSQNIWIKLSILLFILYNIILGGRLLIDHKGYSLGSCFFHPFFLQSLFMPILLFTRSSFFFYIKNKSSYLLWLAIICLPFAKIVFIELIMLYIYIQLIFTNFRFKINFKSYIIIFFCLFVLWYNVIILDNRFILLLIILVLGGIITIKYLQKYKIIVWSIYISIPLIFFICLYTLGISLFNIPSYSKYFKSDNALITDTRTFLYLETKQSLINNDAVWNGLGLNGKITTVLSSDIDSSVDQKGKRSFVEANFLELARRGGGIYIILYSCLLLFSSFQALKAQNRFMQNIAFFITSSHICSLIGMIYAMNFDTILIFLCISLSLNKRLITMKEERIYALIDNKNIYRI